MPKFVMSIVFIIISTRFFIMEIKIKNCKGTKLQEKTNEMQTNLKCLKSND